MKSSCKADSSGSTDFWHGQTVLIASSTVSTQDAILPISVPQPEPPALPHSLLHSSLLPHLSEARCVLRPPQVQLLRETRAPAIVSDIRQCIPLARCVAAFQGLKAIAFLSLLKVSPLLDEVLESEPLFRGHCRDPGDPSSPSFKVHL